MPDTGVFTNNGTYLGYLTTWNNNGRPLAPATVSTLIATGVTNNDATLGATFDTNTKSTNVSLRGSYFLEYKLETDASWTQVFSGTRSVTSPTSPSQAVAQNLRCNRTYNYRAQASNGGGSSDIDAAGANADFTTSACTAPGIDQGASVDVGMSEDSDPSPFSLQLTVTEDDVGTLNWTTATVRLDLWFKVRRV